MNFKLDFEHPETQDLHMHTTFSDGENSAEEMVRSAVEKGITRIGISDHSYTSFIATYCLLPEKYEEYKAAVNACRDILPEGTELYLGIEHDFYSDVNKEDYDYTIGSVHFLRVEYDPEIGIPEGSWEEDGYVYFSIDDTREEIMAACNAYYDGDIYAVIEDYFDNVYWLPEKCDPDIIGHFDLISKLNEDGTFFDPHNEAYVSAWKDAADEIIARGIPFEINTGAISRGYRTKPYPSQEIMDYIREKGGRFIYSSDSHSAENVAYMFETLKV